MPDISVLNVILHDQKIGTLTALPGERILFSFSQDYIEDADRPTLSLSFKDQMGALITDIRPTQTRVPPFFSNLLPEGSLRDYLATRAGINAKREFHLLWVLGLDLPGGITIEPSDNGAWPPASEGGSDGEHHGHDGPGTVFRFSLAGVQLKFSAVMEATGGLTIPAQGVGGSWIIKLPSMKFDAVPENEYAMMTLAREIGIDVPEVRLVELEAIAGLPDGIGQVKGSALAVRRFDRTESGGTIHIEDFAQIFGVYPEKKYERASYRNLAEVIWAEIGADGVAEFIRRLVFNALIGNADMHLKNWSLIYPNQRQAALSPGYDFVSTIAYLDDENMALKFVRSRKMSDLSTDMLARFAAKSGLPEKLVLDTSLETVDKFNSAWTNERKHLPLSDHTVTTIDQHLGNIELIREITKN